ncbi:MAG TPA: hypothetical protein VIO13_12855 [Candidatus Dormibacteraeota bacterium]|jgi:hypothetical protein
MPRHTGRVSKRVSEQLRRLDQLLHIDHSGQSEWVWATPILAFVGTVAILVTAGAMSGVWAVEYIPTGLVVGLVISGLLVACMTPETVPPENDHGDDRGPGTEPSSKPPRFDPGIWKALLSEPDVETTPADEERSNERLREPVGASR